MLKSGLSAFALAAMVASAGFAQAADLDNAEALSGLYLSGSMGVSYADSDQAEIELVDLPAEIFFETGWMGAAAIGFRSENHWRSELELAVHRNALDKIKIDGNGCCTVDLSGRTSVFSVLAKIDYDFDLGALRPFLGAGLGLGRFSVEVDGERDHDMALAVEAETGVSFAVTEKVDLFTVAQLLVLGDVTLDPDDTGGATLSTPLFISGLAGLRVNF